MYIFYIYYKSFGPKKYIVQENFNQFIRLNKINHTP